MKPREERNNTFLEEFVTYKVMGWVIGIIFLVLGWLMTSTVAANNKVDNSVASQSTISAKLDVISNDVSWIKESISSKK